ncbi:MAG TPA: tyrosine-type recombinase/integrase [Nitrobacter sp.]|nr:tyrosine-type recombinase/integrase [Nitrobacter sp.]
MKAVKQQIEDCAWYGAAEAVSWKAAVVSWAGQWKQLGIKSSTGSRYLVSLNQLRPWLDDKDVQQVDPTLLKEIVKQRRKLASNATVRRDLTAISSVLGHCVDEDWIEENPAHMMDRSRFQEKRLPIVLPREASITQVLAVGSRFIDMAALSRETGMREEEIAGLEHDRIDRKRMAASLEDTKGNAAREVPLTMKALEIIDHQPQHFKAGWVFWRGNGERFQNVASQFYATIRRVARKAAQEGMDFRRFRFHDLRHLFAVEYLRQRRGTLYELQRVMGHKSIKTTEEYLAHLTPEEHHAAIHGVAQNPAQDQRFTDESSGKNG